jgi:hypothetical protein
MSTSNTLVDMDIKPAVVTYGVYSVEQEIKEKDGTTKNETILKATMSEKALEKAKAEGTFLFEQSFSYDIPGTIAGMQQLAISDEEKINIFRQGLVAKVGREITSALSEQDSDGNAVFQPVEGNFDARPFAATESGRRGLTDTEKALKTMKNLSPDVLAQVLAMLQANTPQ